MKVLITGGAGFLGSLLAARLLEHGLSLAGAARTPLQELFIADIAPPPNDVAEDPRVRTHIGELDQSLPQMPPVDAIFHLAGIVSSAAEADFDLGMRTNVDGTRTLLEWARHSPGTPVVVLTSSLAVFGADPFLDPLGPVDDQTTPRPQTSYGTQKYIAEQLVADYTRKRFLRGRSVRLMTVAVRPGKPNAAASSFISSIIREPLLNQRATCPVSPDTPIAVSSPSTTIDGIIRAAEALDTEWGSRTAVNLPALTTTPREMLETLDRFTQQPLSSLVDWAEDDSVRAIVDSWPSRFVTTRATRLGLSANTSFGQIISEHMGTAGTRP